MTRRSGRNRRRGRGVRGSWWLLLPATLVLAGVLAVVRAGDESALPARTDSGVEHVHGLGIDPADGVLYAATHNGLFRVPEEGTASRVGDRYQDTMGFTVVGPNHFLGSGHPDIDDRQLRRAGSPPLLGLIESRDAGESWEPLSLLGEADFHGLVTAHDRVYGFDATNGRFMVTEDKTTWETRSQIAIASFGVDPADPDRIIATTEQGLGISSDGGRTWGAAAGPSVVFLDWDVDTGIWGIDAAGDVYNDAAGDGKWELRGSLPGRPEALLVDRSVIYAAVMNGSGVTEIRYSTDQGSSWQLRYRDP